MKRITIRAVEGRNVRDPISKAALSSAWVTKDDSVYWQKRIRQGDVELKADDAAVKVTSSEPVIHREVKLDKTLKNGEKENGDIQ